MGAAESNKKYRESEKGKATTARWLASEAGKASRKRIQQSEKGAQAQAVRDKRYRSVPEKFEIARNANRRWRAQLKHDVLVAYSQEPPICACCRETTEAFLTIDHVNGGGRRHRASTAQHVSGFYVTLRKAGFPRDPELQVLCFNCNCGKRSNDGICPHQM